jgi:hypothetical protein
VLEIGRWRHRLESLIDRIRGCEQRRRAVERRNSGDWVAVEGGGGSAQFVAEESLGLRIEQGG